MTQDKSINFDYHEINFKKGIVTGTTAGCGCCSSEYNLTKEDMADVISNLKNVLAQCEEIYNKM